MSKKVTLYQLYGWITDSITDYKLQGNVHDMRIIDRLKRKNRRE